MAKPIATNVVETQSCAFGRAGFAPISIGAGLRYLEVVQKGSLFFIKKWQVSIYYIPISWTDSILAAVKISNFVSKNTSIKFILTVSPRKQMIGSCSF
jgi:hypothetical protein